MNLGLPCMLVSAVGGEGSAPRKTESHMLVGAAGRICGTVGGGAVEGMSIAHAKELLACGKSDLRTFELHEQAADDIGMICGGRVDVHFQYVRPGDTGLQALAREALRCFDEGILAYLIIDLSGHAMAFYAQGKLIGEDIPQQVLNTAGACACRLGMQGREFYCEQLVHPDRVFVFGGGHVAQALVPVLASVGFRCIIVEDREEFCKKELFPQVQETLLLREEDWKNAIDAGPEDYICIMTRGHQNDLACQAFALRTQAGYIGVIGSRRKIASVNARLSDMGFSQADIARIVTPIGLEIGAITPAEIAVSIAAQMIAYRAGRRKGHTKKSCMG